MSAPSSSRRRTPRRTVHVLGREYRDVAYTPKFALGIICTDEAEQTRLYDKLAKAAPGKEVKVLVI